MRRGGSPVVEPEPGGVTSSTVAVDPNEVGAAGPLAGGPCRARHAGGSGRRASSTPSSAPAYRASSDAGDTRSGEIEVSSPVRAAAVPSIVRSTLLLRQLGAAGGWFVIAATSPNAAITAPAAGAAVPAGPLTVTGRRAGLRGQRRRPRPARRCGRRAAERGRHHRRLPGRRRSPTTSSSTCPVRSRARWSRSLVRGGVGLETDPGEFAAIPVVIDRLTASGTRRLRVPTGRVYG